MSVEGALSAFEKLVNTIEKSRIEYKNAVLEEVVDMIEEQRMIKLVDEYTANMLIVKIDNMKEDEDRDNKIS